MTSASGAERGNRVFDRTTRIGDAAVGLDDRRQREAVDVENLSRRQRRARSDDLVSSRKDRDAGLRVYGKLAASHRGDSADPSGIEQHSLPGDDGAGSDVRSSTTDVLSRRGGRANVDEPVAGG
jgi:hypothetical protein